jgi:hypothetical protein
LLGSIDGTGRLYKLTDSTNQLKWERLDNSAYIGYDFGDLKFSFDDKILSYGGYGFWKSNGLMRYFKWEEKGWDLINLNRELISQFEGKMTAVQFDTIQNKIALCNPNFSSEGFLQGRYSMDSLKNTCWFLDFEKGEWKLLGQTKLRDMAYIGPSPWGAFCIAEKGGSGLLMDIFQNRIYLMKASAYNKYSRRIGKEVTPKTSYFSDSTFYFGDLKLNTWDSIHFSRNDFETVGTTLYTQSNSSIIWPFQWTLYLLCGCLVIALSIILILFRKLNSKPIAPLLDMASTKEPIEYTNHSQTKDLALSEVELQLLHHFLQKMEDGKMVMIEDMNQLLGVFNKNESVQKKMRSDCIRMLNLKLTTKFGTSVFPIQKKRAAADKRIFEYFLEEQTIPNIKRLLENQNADS